MDAGLHRAAQLLRVGRAQEAVSVLDALLSSEPGNVEALQLRGMARGHLGRFEAGAADLEAAAKRHPQPHAVQNNLGNLRRRAGDIDGAMAAYRAALAVMPRFADAALNMASCLAETGKLEEAAVRYRSVLDTVPDHPQALNGLGAVLLRLDRFEEAVTAFDRALARDGNAVRPLVNRGALHRRTKHFEASLADLERACRLAPEMAEAHFQLGHTLRTVGRLEAARQAYREAVRRAPLRADIHRDLAGLLWEMGEGEGATAELDAVLSARPDAGLYYIKGRILMRTRQPQRAAEAAAAALAVDPGHAAALAMQGEIRGKLGDVARGLEDLRAALAASGGGDFEIRHQLVETCLAAGRAEEALEALDAEPPPAHLQKHVALQATAWRCMGDDRYHRLYDYDRLTAKRFIQTPAGYASLDEFNLALTQSIERLHATKAQPIEQTLFGGTQSPGRLWDVDDPVIRALGGALLEAAYSFVSSLPDEADHPFLRRRTGRLALSGAWSVRLHSGGGHVDHIHPAGWISASYYVKVPQSVLDGDKAGWLRLGAPGIADLDLPAERYIRPEAGAAIFFPSYMWHGVEPFESDEVRITAPFDLLPE